MPLVSVPRGISAVEWTPPELAEYTAKSSYSGKATVINRGGVTSGFRAKVTVAPRSDADALAWKSFAMQTRSKANLFRLPAIKPNLQAAAPISMSVYSSLANYALRNTALSNAVWTRTGLTSVTQVPNVSPLGLPNDAFFASETTANSQHSLTQSISGAVTGSYTFSTWATYVLRRYLMLIINGSAIAVFDLVAGVVVQTSSATAGMIADDFGWWRCWVASTASFTPTSITILWGDTGTISAILAGYTGIVGYGALLWRPQLEAGQRPTPCVLTAGAAVNSNNAILASGSITAATVIKAGGHVAFYNRLHTLTEDCVADGNGLVNMALAPPLGGGAVAGDLIFTRAPFARMRVTSGSGWSDRIGYGETAEFECEEAL